MNRRSFFSFLSIAPIVGAGVALAYTEKDMAPAENRYGALLRLGDKQSVGISVGKDGRLWLKSEGGDWRRIALE